MVRKIANVIRIISIPPIMVTLMLVFLRLFVPGFFGAVSEMIIMLILLGLFPVIAYAVHYLVPSLKKTGRDGQRKLAFAFTYVGYAAAFVWGLIAGISEGPFIIVTAYIISVTVLTVINLLKIKASGHAASFTGPLLFLSYFISWWLIIPCVVFAVLVCWSSLYLKRHTLPQLLIGILTSTVSCIAAILILA